MKLSASLLIAIADQSARAAEAPEGCCEYLTIDTQGTSGLTNLDNSLYYQFSGKNNDGNNYYQAVSECGAELKSGK